MRSHNIARRNFLLRILAGGGAALIGGCDRLSRTAWFPSVLQQAENLDYNTQRLIMPLTSMAQEFGEADLSPVFRSNGTANPDNALYQKLAADGFSAYRLRIFGLVENPASFSLSDLRSLPNRTQITRHDCVEGWSAIGKWKGARFGALLDLVRPKSNARYAVLYCADPMDRARTQYYESIGMDDAYHPQTLLAYELNDQRLPIANGAPIRLRVERQLGYKMAKYVMAIELTDSFGRIGLGKGGYWEDLGYEWYAGI